MKYKICPACGMRIELEKRDSQILLCQNPNCPAPNKLFLSAIMDDQDEIPESVAISQGADGDSHDGDKSRNRELDQTALTLSLREKKSGLVLCFSLPAILQRDSFPDEDLAITEECHAIVDTSGSFYLISDNSRYHATWVNGVRLDTETTMVCCPGNDLRLGNSEFLILEVAHENE